MSRPYRMDTKLKPRWYDLRWKLSSWLVEFARWVHPGNPDVWAYFVENAIDKMISGELNDHAEPGAWLEERTRHE